MPYLDTNMSIPVPSLSPGGSVDDDFAVINQLGGVHSIVIALTKGSDELWSGDIARFQTMKDLISPYLTKNHTTRAYIVLKLLAHLLSDPPYLWSYHGVMTLKTTLSELTELMIGEWFFETLDPGAILNWNEVKVFSVRSLVKWYMSQSANRNSNQVYFDDISAAIEHMTVLSLLITSSSPSSFPTLISKSESEESILPLTLHSLGKLLRLRFERQGDIEDINDAIYNLSIAIDLILDTNSTKPGCCNLLGLSFLDRFERLGDIQDLNLSIEIHTRSINLTPEDNPESLAWHCNLGDALLSRFERLGDIQDVHRAISHHTRAVSLTPDGDHIKKSLRCNSLGNSYFRRFLRLGDLEDVSRAVENHAHAVELTPEGYRSKFLRHNNLGNSSLARFERLGDVKDVNRAVEQHTYAVNLVPGGHLQVSSCHANLGSSYLERFKRLMDVKDINCAVEHHEQAMKLTLDDHPDKATWHGNLGVSLLNRFQHLASDRDIQDLNLAIENHERAIELTPNGHPNVPSMLSNLGNSLAIRFRHLKNSEDIDRSIRLFTDAQDLTPEGHIDQINYYLNVCQSLADRANIGNARGDDIEQAIMFAIKAANLAHAPPFLRFLGAHRWANLLHEQGSGDHNNPDLVLLLEAYRSAIMLLPCLSWVGVNPQTRFHQLRDTSGVASDAAAIAISSGQPDLALEWLEQARSVVWSQLLQMRTPLDGLVHLYPELGSRIKQIWALLDGIMATSSQRIDLALELNDLIAQVRKCPGFERFLLPLEISSLCRAACNGPVVLLNASQFRCDALILGSSSLSHFCHIPLERCTFQRLKKARELFRRAIAKDGFARRSFRRVLSFLYQDVVSPCLDYLSSLQFPPVGDSGLMHIRWCPTGLFTSLPIHAAGIYGEDNTPVVSLSDRAISSYTTTLSSLLTAFDRKNTTSNIPDKILAVIQPVTPGESDLPGTLEELECLELQVKHRIPLKSLIGKEAVVDSVVDAMKDNSVIHFACHGVQDVVEPLSSGLLLQDGTLQLSKMIETKLPNSKLVFLSACQTAMGDDMQPDEAIHLAAGMLAAGFRSVVATMWSIPDGSTPMLAGQFYALLLRDGNINNGDVAEALHNAVQHLKQLSPEFKIWVPFIHMGV